MTSKIVITYNKLPQIAARLPSAVGMIVRKAALDVEAHAKNSMKGPKHGRMYKVSKTGKLHQASAPGEAPAVDTGTLKNSITTEMIDPVTAVVAPHTEYAGALEYGTRKMRPRPYMRPAAEKVASSFIEACKRLEDHLR